MHLFLKSRALIMYDTRPLFLSCRYWMERLSKRLSKKISLLWGRAPAKSTLRKGFLGVLIYQLSHSFLSAIILFYGLQYSIFFLLSRQLPSTHQRDTRAPSHASSFTPTTRWSPVVVRMPSSRSVVPCISQPCGYSHLLVFLSFNPKPAALHPAGRRGRGVKSPNNSHRFGTLSPGARRKPWYTHTHTETDSEFRSVISAIPYRTDNNYHAQAGHQDAVQFVAFHPKGTFLVPLALIDPPSEFFGRFFYFVLVVILLPLSL